MSSVIHGYPTLSLHLVFFELQGFNLTAGSRLFHCDEQALKTNLTGNRTEIQHSPLEEGACVCECEPQCVWVSTNVFVE